MNMTVVEAVLATRNSDGTAASAALMPDIQAILDASPGETVLTYAVVGAYEDTQPGGPTAPKRMLDVVTIMGIVSALLEILKNVKDNLCASSKIKAGSALAYGSALKAVRHGGFEGSRREERDFAHAIVNRGRLADDQQLGAVLDAASLVPQPKVSTGPWPMIVALVIWITASTAYAAPWPEASVPPVPSRGSQAWPTEELDALSKKLDALDYKLNYKLDGQGKQLDSIEDAVDRLGELLKKMQAKSEPVTQQATPVPAEAAPTPYEEVARVLALLPRPEVAFVDYGCGADARWCTMAAEKWGCHAIGVELNAMRAQMARDRVRDAGLSHLVTIIEGDATSPRVQAIVHADVGVAYLYPDVLQKLKPQLEKLKAFASYMHQPPGLAVSKSGDTWLYMRPIAQPQQGLAVYQGYQYQAPVCNNPNCAMCNAIRQQLNMRSRTTVQVYQQPAYQPVMQQRVYCRGRYCYR
jgi:hypothetical protein